MGLLLSAVLGGPEQMDKPFDKIARSICRRTSVHEKRLIDANDGIINVWFQYSGSLLQPDFAGVRTSGYSKEKRLLAMEVAFPTGAMSPDRFATQYVVLLKDALAEGQKFFDKKGVPFSLEAHLALVDRSVQGLRPRWSSRMEDHKYQLVLQLPGTTQSDFDLLIELEESLVEIMESAGHAVDGHDFGSGTMNIFIDTNDPAAAFLLAKRAVNPADHPLLKAAYRSFEEDDYHLIWPENSTEEFDLM
jgi:hypothetical protein